MFNPHSAREETEAVAVMDSPTIIQPVGVGIERRTLQVFWLLTRFFWKPGSPVVLLGSSKGHNQRARKPPNNVSHLFKRGKQ